MIAKTASGRSDEYLSIRMFESGFSLKISEQISETQKSGTENKNRVRESGTELLFQILAPIFDFSEATNGAPSFG